MLTRRNQDSTGEISASKCFEPLKPSATFICVIEPKSPKEVPTPEQPGEVSRLFERKRSSQQRDQGSSDDHEVAR
ncbi:MAG: hypothetical protein DME93_12475 [Verrucomicrobia bacterium]|nr:MAG: hypothetical protein DME93_12475 [Verrucomicrobiota bacterium]